MNVNVDGKVEKQAVGCDFNVPGPGSYQPAFSHREKSLSTRFGSERRQSMSAKGAELTPGPNAYNSAYKSSVVKSAPAFGFGTSKRP
jgi:hypothetical protein